MRARRRAALALPVARSWSMGCLLYALLSGTMAFPPREPRNEADGAGGGVGGGEGGGAGGAAAKDWKSEYLLQRAAAASEIRRAQVEAVAKARATEQQGVSERKEANRARVEEGRQRSKAAQQQKAQRVLEAAAAVRMPYRPMPDATLLAGVAPASAARARCGPQLADCVRRVKHA